MYFYILATHDQAIALAAVLYQVRVNRKIGISLVFCGYTSDVRK